MVKVLVVDDDKLIRWSLKELLTQEGYSVDVAASVTEALKQMENAFFDLVFADLDIDEGSGLEMLKKVKFCQPQARVIILSARSKPQVESQLGGLSVFHILEKPFKSEEISTIARKALEISRSGSSSEDNLDSK